MDNETILALGVILNAVSLVVMAGLKWWWCFAANVVLIIFLSLRMAEVA